MSEWREVRLSEVSSLIVDSEHKTAPKDPDGLHPLIRTTDLGKARADFRGAQRVSAAIHARWTARAVPSEGDLILAREAPVGGICRVPPEVSPVLGQRTVLVRPDPAAVDSGFLSYRLAAPDLQARLCEMSTGSTVPHLNMSDIRALTISDVPSLNTQRRIAIVLSAFDDLVEINERRIALLEDLARSLYREWFLRFRFPGLEDATFVGSARGEIPERWMVRRLDAIAAIVMGQSPRSEFYNEISEGLPFHQGVADYGDLLPTHRKFCTLESRTADAMDVLCSVRAPVGRLNLADERLVIGRGLAAIRRVDHNQALLLEQLRSPLGEEDSLGSGTIFKAINKEQLGGLPIVEPTAAIARAFELKARPMLDERVQRTLQNRQLAGTRDLLLPRLVTGRLEISDIDLGALLPAEAA